MCLSTSSSIPKSPQGELSSRSLLSSKKYSDRKFSDRKHTTSESEWTDVDPDEEAPVSLEAKPVFRKLREWPSRQPLAWTGEIHTAPCPEGAKPRTETEVRRDMVQNEWPETMRTAVIAEKEKSSFRILFSPGIERRRNEKSRDDFFEEFAVW